MAGGIKLQWKDRNFSEDQHNIYRSNTPMTLGMLPTPIATLGSNVTEYIDYDVIEGNTYYYRIGAVRGNDEAVSDELEIVAEEMDFGPGNQVLIAGDMSAGFFGEVPTSELITGDDLATQIGLSAGTSQFSDEPWLKFALDDDIIYVAKKPYRHSINWQRINDLGAFYGDLSITVQDYIFNVSVLKGANSDPTPSSSSDVPSGVDVSEWNRLMYPIHSGIHTSGTIPNLNSFGKWNSYSDLDLITNTNLGNGSYSWCQETPTSATNRRITRGALGITSLRESNVLSANRFYGWRPALRLQR